MNSNPTNTSQNESTTPVIDDHSTTRQPPLERHVFQTIFLDHSPESRQFWTKGEIDSNEVILEKWWKQQSHRWQHYAGTVPWMGLINGKVSIAQVSIFQNVLTTLALQNHTQFAGAWTVLSKIILFVN